MHQRAAVRRLESKLNRLGVDYDPACEEDPPFICINSGPNSDQDGHFLYITFLKGDRCEFYWFTGGLEFGQIYHLEQQEDLAFGSHLRRGLKELGY